MRIVFLGARQHYKPEGSSLYVASDRGDYNFIINCTTGFLNHADQIDDIDFFLLQNPNKASMGGIAQLHEWMKKKDLNHKIPVYMDETTFDSVKLCFKELNHIEPKVIIPGTEFAPNDYILIEPFYYMTSGDIHSVGYRFRNTVYAPGIIELPFESMKYFKNAAIIISESEKTVDMVNKFQPELFITSAEHVKPDKEIKTDIMSIRNTMELMTTEVISETLSESREAINLANPHAELIWTGNKTLMVKDKFYKNQISKPLYLLQNNICYGIIRLKLPDKITVKEFRELSKFHKISEEQRQKWWPNKEVLYSYRFDIVKMFENPVPIETIDEFSIFIRDFKFTQHIRHEKNKETTKTVVKNFAKLCDEGFDLQIVQKKQKKKVYKRMQAKKIYNNTKDAIDEIRLGKIVIEKKCNGDRVFLTKTGSVIKIFKSGRDITKSYSYIVSSAQRLSNKNFVLDCIIVNDDFVCFDILKYDDDVQEHQWFERKQLLHNLYFSGKIKEMPSIIAGSVSQVEQAMLLMSKLSNSSGAILKTYDENSGYVQEESDRWVEFSEGATSTSTPGIPSVQGKKIQKKKPSPIKPGQ